MGSNPFAITSEELLKRQQGVQGTGDSGKTENTKETREAKETQKLKSTDVYSLADQNGGSMATTDGVFENYDGFTRTTQAPAQKESKEEKDGKSLLDRTFGATGEAKTQKSNCQDYQDVAADDEKFVNQQVKKQKQAETKTRNEVNNIINQKEELRSENESLRSEVDSLNSEISSLMAEDGQTYTPQEAPEEAAMPQPQAQGGGADNTAAPTGDGSMTSSTSGDSAGGAAAVGGATSGGSAAVQQFAMNSLPSGGEQSVAPTSITAVSAQNSQKAQEAGQGNNKKQAQQQQGAANKAAGKSGAGNSLQAFGNSLVKPKGKNADKINELLDQVSTKNNQITSNSSSISSLTTSGNQKTDSFQAQLKAIMNQTVTKKTNNTDNYKGAQTAQTIGTVTTTTGGLATATGASMLALSWGSNQLGTALMAGGGVATAAGTGTTSIAQATQGDTQNAVNTATNGLNSFTNNMMQVRQIKQDNNAA